jgi:hypothetical protein
MAFKHPVFGKLQDALNEAGVVTGSARGFWGGVTPDDDIVVTAWLNEVRGDRCRIHKPRTRHGGLLDMWEMGRIAQNVTVRLILLRSKGYDSKGDHIYQAAGLTAGRWKIISVDDDGEHATVEPVRADQAA